MYILTKTSGNITKEIFGIQSEVFGIISTLLNDLTIQQFMMKLLLTELLGNILLKVFGKDFPSPFCQEKPLQKTSLRCYWRVR